MDGLAVWFFFFVDDIYFVIYISCSILFVIFVLNCVFISLLHFCRMDFEKYIVTYKCIIYIVLYIESRLQYES